MKIIPRVENKIESIELKGEMTIITSIDSSSQSQWRFRDIDYKPKLE